MLRMCVVVAMLLSLGACDEKQKEAAYGKDKRLSPDIKLEMTVAVLAVATLLIGAGYVEKRFVA